MNRRADDIDLQFVFSRIREGAFGKLRGESVAPQLLGNLGVLERKNAGTQGVLEIGDMTVAFEFEASGSDLLWLLFRAEHKGHYSEFVHGDSTWVDSYQGCGMGQLAARLSG